MYDVKVHGFYRGGAHVTVTESQLSSSHQIADNTHTFGASYGYTVASKPKDIGYTPKGNAKLLKGPAYEVIEYDGRSFLALNGGHVYSVTILRASDDNASEHVVSAESGSIALVLPKDAAIEVQDYKAKLKKDKADKSPDGDNKE